MPVAAALIVALAAQPAGATKIQRVVSPGGIEAWLVHEPSLPLVALNFAFVGGASQDPADKPGVGYMIASLLDDGAGELDAKAFQQRLEDNAVELSLLGRSRTISAARSAMLQDRKEPSFDLLRLALNAAALRCRRGRARARADPGRAASARPPIPSSIAIAAWWQHRLSRTIPTAGRRNGTLDSRCRPSRATTCGPMRAAC